jgi:hypothetical protein
MAEGDIIVIFFDKKARSRDGRALTVDITNISESEGVETSASQNLGRRARITITTREVANSGVAYVVGMVRRPTVRDERPLIIAVAMLSRTIKERGIRVSEDVGEVVEFNERERMIAKRKQQLPSEHSSTRAGGARSSRDG